MNIALLIIDMQKEFYENNIYKESLTDALEYINETSQMFRKLNKPVIVIQDEEAGDGPGTPGFENISELITTDTDHLIHKFYSNAFWQTKLEELLKSLDVQFLVISGFAAEHGVLFTYNGALERSFSASILQHGVAGLDKKNVESLQQLRPVVSLDALYYFLHCT
jgi:nicotinamidase-related amidase